MLMISDDGVGIPQSILSTILSGTGNSNSGGTNIAVYNTHRRLQILYGADYGLSYTSQVNIGTEVQIRIPARKKTEHTGNHYPDPLEYFRETGTLTTGPGRR